MKNNFILISLALSVFASCNNSDDLMNMEGDAMIPETRSIESLPYYVENGVLNFRSADDFFFYADSISNLSGYAFENWEKVTGFTSYRSITDEMIGEIEDVEDNEFIYDKLLLNYSDFVEKVDDRVETKIKSNIYKSVVNKDGVFYVDGIRHLVDDCNVITSRNGENINTVPYVTNVLTRTTTGSASLPLGFREKYGDDRMVFTQATVRRIYAMDVYRICVEVFIDGKKKGPAKWKQYATKFWMIDFLVRLPNVATSLTSNGHADKIEELEQPAREKDGSGNEVNVGNWSKQIWMGEATRNPLDLAYPTYLYYKAWSQGVPEGVIYKMINGVLQ